MSACTSACLEETVGSTDVMVEGVDLDLLFADPAPAEIAAVSAEWEARSLGASDVVVEKDTIVVVGALDLRVRILSHTVDGFRHYGAVLNAAGLTGPARVIVYSHGGDSGVSIEEVVYQFPLVGASAAELVWVVPSFRSEALSFAGESWTSEGAASPWDYDVDDGLSLLDVAIQVEPAADPDEVVVLGFSRGAGVGLLMGVRDPRIDRIVEFFGPTDFFDEFARGVVEDALRGTLRDLPGLETLNSAHIQPLRLGALSMAEARAELIRRSPVLFAERLPDVQIHHGTADAVVAVSQAESLIAALEGLGRGQPGFQSFLYSGGGHNPLTLPGSIQRSVDFLVAFLPSQGPDPAGVADH